MRRDRTEGARRSGVRDRADAAPRSDGRGDELRGHRDRLRIAQTAARLIVEHGITDWSLAKRKAARQLMLPIATPMPSNDAIEQALADHHALFGGAAHTASLRQQREAALGWMRRLSQWEPLLVGGVAAGWASAHSDVLLELVADDPKTVEIALASAGVAYDASAPRDDDGNSASVIQLRIATPRAGIRLSLLTPSQRRNRPRRDGEARMDIDAVTALLAAN